VKHERQGEVACRQAVERQGQVVLLNLFFILSCLVFLLICS